MLGTLTLEIWFTSLLIEARKIHLFPSLLYQVRDEGKEEKKCHYSQVLIIN